MSSVDLREQLSKALPDIPIVTRDTSEYLAQTAAWSLAQDLHPAIVLVPQNEEQLAQAVKYLYGSCIDFAVRGTGSGGASSPGVVISMQKFNTVEWSERQEYFDVGAGLTAGDVDKRVDELAPGYVVLTPRCPFLGITGSTLNGGLSWLSHELGLGSDPGNLLDVRLVLADGRCVWAIDEDSNLMWALRGGGGNFGIATKLRLKARKYTARPWTGMIVLPTSDSVISEVSTLVSKFAKKKDPKLALHVFIYDFSMRSMQGSKPEPSLALVPFDAYGEAHAFSDDGFRWALNIQGAQAQCAEMSLTGVNESQRSLQAIHGKTHSWLSAPLVQHIDQHLIERAWSWYHSTVQEHQNMAGLTCVLLEIMQEAAMLASGSPTATAWPHAALGRQHVLQLGIGGMPGRDRAENESLYEIAKTVLTAAPETISGQTHDPAHYLPAFAMPWNDLSAIYGMNWEKLRGLKTRYDPEGRFKRGSIIPLP